MANLRFMNFQLIELAGYFYITCLRLTKPALQSNCTCFTGRLNNVDNFSVFSLSFIPKRSESNPEFGMEKEMYNIFTIATPKVQIKIHKLSSVDNATPGVSVKSVV